MTTHIYVAGGSSEIERVRAFIAAAREIAGVEITMDWPAHVAQAGAADAALPEHVLVEAAELDLQGVVCADVVIFLVPARVSQGMQTELGIAIAATVHTVGVGAGPLALGLFGVLVDEWVSSDAAALAWLRTFAAARAA
jgi:hypothetical protein